MIRFELLYLLLAPITLPVLLLYIFWAAVKRISEPAARLLAIPLGPVSIAYNLTVGSLLYWERPREWFFTTRLKRYENQPETQRFKAVLNHFDPGHV